MTTESKLHRLLNTIIWQINRSPLQPALKWLLRLTCLPEIRKRRLLAAQLPLHADRKIYAKQLADNGYSIVTPVIDREQLEALRMASVQKLALAREAANSPQTKKAFWTRLLDGDMTQGKLPVSNPFVRFALQPTVIEIVANVLGEIPRLNYVLLTLSQHSKESLHHSQLWHRDHDNDRVIKLFVYLTDVRDQQDGPFTFLPGPVSDRFGYSLKNYRDDNAVFNSGRAQTSDTVSMIAPMLSVFMIETSRCMHMGSRVAPEHHRLLYTAMYTTVPALYPGLQNPFTADVAAKDAVEAALLDLQR